ncbi:hypothetical protein [Enterococcus malodoratus]|uniref:hypothetical protein n=1 Tax=Enterococcus malodoratus TaxID=71451 RepID=UPI00039B215D|nr:hypothetical protein [Enterococcus malodoratus]OJG66338.1 hypothetical protein RV07_GL000131 [Enterococcus malodoratus]
MKEEILGSLERFALLHPFEKTMRNSSTKSSSLRISKQQKTFLTEVIEDGDNLIASSH